MTKAAVLGSPIIHSLSPNIHQSAYRFLGWDWSYGRFEVKSGDLAEFLTNHRNEFRALSLTMPLKEEALSLLDSLTDLAKQTNSVNTIVFDELGSHGFNTDVGGFRDSLKFHKVAIPDEIAILGGGATARSAVAALDGSAKIINVYVRSEHRGKSLVNSAKHSIVNIKSWRELHESGAGLKFELVISTTPRGATDEFEPREVNGVLFESLYHPWPTPLLERWKAGGGAGIDGLDLLVWQAIGQLEVMSFDGLLTPRDSEKGVDREELYRQMRAEALQTILSR